MRTWLVDGGWVQYPDNVVPLHGQRSETVDRILQVIDEVPTVEHRQYPWMDDAMLTAPPGMRSDMFIFDDPPGLGIRPAPHVQAAMARFREASRFSPHVAVVGPIPISPDYFNCRS